LEEILAYIEEKRKFIMLALVGIVVILLGVVFWQFLPNQSEEESTEEVYEELLAETELEAEPEEAASHESDAEENIAEVLVVDVKGAVNSPGVYQMAPNSRVVDAIEKAEGFQEEAEQNAVNLAQLLEDQMVIYVPEVGEEGVEMEHLAPTEAADTSEEATTQVDLNRADKAELTTLNGIGDSKAESILSYREENGNFQTIEELKEVSGIGEATFEQLKEAIVVHP
jgi:competence protein ComEA